MQLISFGSSVSYIFEKWINEWNKWKSSPLVSKAWLSNDLTAIIDLTAKHYVGEYKRNMQIERRRRKGGRRGRRNSCWSCFWHCIIILRNTDWGQTGKNLYPKYATFLLCGLIKTNEKILCQELFEGFTHISLFNIHNNSMWYVF